MNDSGFASLLGLESGIRSVGVRKGLRLEDEGFVDAGYRRRGLGGSELRDLRVIFLRFSSLRSGYIEI